MARSGHCWRSRGSVAAIMRFASWWSGPSLRPAADVARPAVRRRWRVGGRRGLQCPARAAGDRFRSLSPRSKTAPESGRKRSWLRHGLIVAQVAGSLVLLCGATLCLRSMSRQLSVDLGYRSDRLADRSARPGAHRFHAGYRHAATGRDHPPGGTCSRRRAGCVSPIEPIRRIEDIIDARCRTRRLRFVQ